MRKTNMGSLKSTANQCSNGPKRTPTDDQFLLKWTTNIIGGPEANDQPMVLKGLERTTSFYLLSYFKEFGALSFLLKY